MPKSRSVIRDYIILGLIWVGTTGLLFKYIPKDKIRHGILAFLYKQIVTWLFGLLVDEKGLIKYPVRFFKKANKSSFSFEYFIYSSFCAIFNVNYPEKQNRIIKVLYYLAFTGFITFVELLAERYTKLIEYVKWKWYWSFVTMGITFYLSRIFYCWFFKERSYLSSS